MAERKLDLRTGQPVWTAYRAPAVVTERLKRDLTVDVLIVGMGIGGALAAERLSSAGLKVAVVDRRGPVKGSTPASTALIQFEIDQPLGILSSKVGREKAERAWRRSRLALDALKARIQDLCIECDMIERPSLFLAGDMLGARALEEEAEQRRTAGLAAAFLTRAITRESYGIDRAAIRSQGNLALDPRKLTASLLLLAKDRGARLFAPVEANEFNDHKSNVEVATTGGQTITASHVILATGYELMDFVPATSHKIISTWAIATRRQKSNLWPEKAMAWEASDPYLYFRTTSDGRVICGGEDEDFEDEDKRDALVDAKSKRITAKLKALMPGIHTTPEFKWTGSFGTTTTGLPIIGALPQRPRIFAVMGYGGNGITFAEIAAGMITTSILGAKDPDLDLFAF